MKKALLGIVCALALAGCQTYWTKPGFNVQDWNRDRYECERDMRQSGYYGSGIVGQINVQSFFEECLVARGYYKTRAPNSGPLSDEERMDRLKGQLEAQGIDPNQPPQPETPADAELKKRALLQRMDAPATQPASTTSRIEQRLNELKDMRERGVISEEEYKRARGDVLRGIGQ